MKLSAHRRHRPSTNTDDAVLPLINIVFLLLIFFMVAGRIVPTDPFQVTPPTADGGQVDRDKTIVILLGADGRLAVDDRVIARDALQATVRAALDAEAGRELLLKVDANADSAGLISLLDDLAATGAPGLRLLTQERG